jgi:hypothetical protein
MNVKELVKRLEAWLRTSYGTEHVHISRRDLEAAIAAIKAETARADKAEAELNETYMDDDGTTWNRPTAWAYFSACRALTAANEKLDCAIKHLHTIAAQSGSRNTMNALTKAIAEFPMSANTGDGKVDFKAIDDAEREAAYSQLMEPTEDTGDDNGRSTH